MNLLLYNKNIYNFCTTEISTTTQEAYRFNKAQTPPPLVFEIIVFNLIPVLIIEHHKLFTVNLFHIRIGHLYKKPKLLNQICRCLYFKFKF